MRSYVRDLYSRYNVEPYQESMMADGKRTMVSGDRGKGLGKEDDGSPASETVPRTAQHLFPASTDLVSPEFLYDCNMTSNGYCTTNVESDRNDNASDMSVNQGATLAELRCGLGSKWTMAQRFEQSTFDQGTADWVLAAFNSRSRLKDAAAALLQVAVSRTTANGLTYRGTMHVLSKAQSARLLDRSGLLRATCSSNSMNVLDIGAGDGGVTASLVDVLRGKDGADATKAGREKNHRNVSVYCTEDSVSMRWRLWLRGYKVLPVSNCWRAGTTTGGYNLVTSFNVLDRCERPLSLLKDIYAAIAPQPTQNNNDSSKEGKSKTVPVDDDGSTPTVRRAVIAVVFPWCPMVETGISDRQKQPTEPLFMPQCSCCDNPTFEHCVSMFVTNVLAPIGFEVEAWTRVPYLCQGNFTSHNYFALDNAVFCLKAVERRPVS